MCGQGRSSEAIDILMSVLNDCENQRRQFLTAQDWVKYLTLFHALGDLQNNVGRHIDAAKTFAVVILQACQLYNESYCVGVGTESDIAHEDYGIPRFISSILKTLESYTYEQCSYEFYGTKQTHILISPSHALHCKHYIFPPTGHLPLPDIFGGKQPNSSSSLDAAKSVSVVVGNALLNLAKIFQDGTISGVAGKVVYLNGKVPTQEEILSLYLLSLSLNPSSSTANNVGILLASMSTKIGLTRLRDSQGSAADANIIDDMLSKKKSYKNKAAWDSPSVEVTSDSKNLAIEYYIYGLSLDSNHPHLYTNFGSLLREQGKISDAIVMYERAVECDPKFNIALANLGSTLKDKGDAPRAAYYYQKALDVDPNFVEALSGFVNCQTTLCNWTGRGACGWEPMSVDKGGRLIDGQIEGWMTKFINTINIQLEEARNWGIGAIEFVRSTENNTLFHEVENCIGNLTGEQKKELNELWTCWSGQKDEGAFVLSVIENATRACQRRWYFDRLTGKEQQSCYRRPQLPSILPTPMAVAILPFHAFTLPFNAFQIRRISEKCAARLSMSTLIQPWVPDTIYPPPLPPPRSPLSTESGPLIVGYISSDFVNHPLSHLMKSVFGMHDRTRVLPICYATTPSDNSIYRQHIEQSCFKFRDVSNLSIQQITEAIVHDGVHVLVNLNGFTKGAKNEVFALRPCPVQIAVMGFAGPIGSDWCDYVLGDRTAIPPHTMTDESKWVYKEKIMYMPNSFFVCDHRQSACDSEFISYQKDKRSGKMVMHIDYSRNSNDRVVLDHHSWSIEQSLRMHLKNGMFPFLPSNAFLMANFNQLYKIDPTTLRIWLSILQRLPCAYLWLLQFPKAGQQNICSFAENWFGKEVSSRIIFTPVAEKDIHIFRSRICDLFLDTPECNAHTTAADVIWTGTPIVTYPRHEYKLCSRICASIVTAALPKTEQGRAMVNRLVVNSDQEYEDRVVEFGQEYVDSGTNDPPELMRIRKVLFEHREVGEFFDTRQWVRNFETGVHLAWRDWLDGNHDHIYI